MKSWKQVKLPGIVVTFLAPVMLFTGAGCKTTGAAEPETSETQGAVRDGAANALGVGDEGLENRRKWLKTITDPQGGKRVAVDETSCPVSPSDPCAEVNFIFEIPHAEDSEDVGHTGISVSAITPDGNFVGSAMDRNDPFYDFGPADGASLFKEVDGSQWWDKTEHFPGKQPHEIGFADIAGNAEKFGDYTFVRVPICVSKEHARKIHAYWNKAYAKFPRFRIPGPHCTSMAATSFDTTHPGAKTAEKYADYYLTSYYAKSPRNMVDRVINESMMGSTWNYLAGMSYRHQCGSAKGKLPHAVIIREESALSGIPGN